MCDLSRIPQEMRDYHQWVAWRYEGRGKGKPTKVPYDPRTKRRASVSNPSSWVSFDEIAAHIETGGWDGAGFVFSKNDPYAGVDLDDPEGDPATKVQISSNQKKLYRALDSYSERSPSGKGLHIIVKGSVITGRRAKNIELYSWGRFFTMTGDVSHDAPIADRQEIITHLWEWLGGPLGKGQPSNKKSKETTSSYNDVPEKRSDSEIVRIASRAANGEKFKRLYSGDWGKEYASQSEADLSLMNILAFYTQNRDQLMRLFRNSALGQREKANRGQYLDYTINRALDRAPPKINTGKITMEAPKVLKKNRVHEDRTEIATDGLKPPPGLVGDIANFIYSASPRPVMEISIAAAIGLMSGVCGRSYNVSGTGLNNYILLLAPTGTGKEAMQSGIEKFIAHARGRGGEQGNLMAMPEINDFLGPAEISSGQALLKHIAKQRSFCSVVGEFGLTMQRLANARASSYEIMYKKVLLDLYNKSGAGNVLRPMIYSDKDNNTEEVVSPAFTLLGESTPETYYSNLDEGLISGGLLPRFVTIEYSGLRPKLNTAHCDGVPHIDLIKRFRALCSNSLHLNSHNLAVSAKYTKDADEFLRSIDDHADNQINAKDQKDVIRHLWNRAHIKTLKLAALVAVGCADHSAQTAEFTITRDNAEWAYGIVSKDIVSISKKFRDGEMGKGTDESRQFYEVMRVINEYLSKNFEEVSNYGAKCEMHADRVIPYTFIQRKLVSVSVFRKDRSGATSAIRRALQSLVDEGAVVELGTDDLLKYNTRGKCYAVYDAARFVE